MDDWFVVSTSPGRELEVAGLLAKRRLRILGMKNNISQIGVIVNKEGKVTGTDQYIYIQMNKESEEARKGVLLTAGVMHFLGKEPVPQTEMDAHVKKMTDEPTNDPNTTGFGLVFKTFV